MFSWSRAANVPTVTMAIAAMFPSALPYDRPPNVAWINSRAAAAIAAAMTMMSDGGDDLGQVGDHAGEHVAHRVGTEDAEGHLQHDEEQGVEDDLGDDVAGVVLGAFERPLDPAPLDGTVEADALQESVGGLADELGYEVADEQDQQERHELRHEGGDVAPGVLDALAPGNLSEHRRCPGLQ